MDNISPEVRAHQAAYAARPFAVRWQDSHFSGEFRFDTFAEAFDYVQTMWTNIRQAVEQRPYRSSMLWQSYLKTPEGRISLRYVLLCEDVSSYGCAKGAQS